MCRPGVEGVRSRAGLVDSRCYRLAGVQANNFRQGPVEALGSDSKKTANRGLGKLYRGLPILLLGDLAKCLISRDTLVHGIQQQALLWSLNFSDYGFPTISVLFSSQEMSTLLHPGLLSPQPGCLDQLGF